MVLESSEFQLKVQLSHNEEVKEISLHRSFTDSGIETKVEIGDQNISGEYDETVFNALLEKTSLNARFYFRLTFSDRSWVMRNMARWII